MKTKEVNINSTLDRIFRKYLEVVKIFPPYNKLRKKELDVLSELLKLEYNLRSIDEVNKWKLIFHHDNRLAIRTSLDMSEPSFNNVLTSLRNKLIIVNNTIPSKFIVDFNEEYCLKINFSCADK